LISDQLQTLWDDVLPSFIRALGDGRVAYEKVWEYEPLSNLHFIRKLEQLPFANTEMLIDSLGRFEGIKLTGGEDPVFLSTGKSFWLAIDGTSTEPHGRSRFVDAPQRVWKRRQKALDLRDLFLKRFVLRGGIAYVPETEKDDATGEIVDVFDATAKAYNDLLAGGLMMFPSDRDTNGNRKFEFDGGELKTMDSSFVEGIIDGMDDEQLLSFGILPQTIQSEGVGSFALVAHHTRILFAVIDDIVRQFVKHFQKYVIDKVIEVNFTAADRPVVRMVYKKLSEEPDSLAMEVVKNWLTSPQLSALILSGTVDVAAMLETAGIPVSDNLSEKLERLFTTLSTSQTPPQTPGQPGTTPTSPVQLSLNLPPVPAATGPNTTPPTGQPSQPTPDPLPDMGLWCQVVQGVRDGNIDADFGGELLRKHYPGVEESRVANAVGLTVVEQKNGTTTVRPKMSPRTTAPLRSFRAGNRN
jgi:hypothetical protein